MSGTSLDGLDVCYCQFQKSGNSWKFKILKSETIPYPKSWEEKLKNSMFLNAEDLLELNAEYGFYLGEKTKDFIAKNKIENLDLIASHGHTVFHQPHRKFTLQIGDGRAIKMVTKTPVVYDFRTQDVLLGGNGAPLVPIGDELLFSEFDACINLGGFSNISLKKDNKRIAFDICPVNIVLNKFSEKLGKKYDEDGAVAKQGKVIPEILEKLNHLDFYEKKHPKSLGLEWVNENVFPLLKGKNPEDILATFTEHIAIQIDDVFKKFGLKKVIFTGGGTFNTNLIEKIKEKSSTEIIIPENDIINYKEALIFALLGVLKMNGEINVLASATGSSEDHSSGIIA